MELRPVSSDDLEACLQIFYASLDVLHERMGEPPVPRNPEALRLVFEHLIATDPEHCWLAEEERRSVAFGLAHQRGDHWYLGFLFVLPEAQSRGIGRALLERCLPPAEERASTRLSVAVEALQPVSTALYAQYGMVPRVPLYVLIGDLRPGVLPDPGAGLARARLEPLAFGSVEDGGGQLAGTLDRLDRVIVGYARPQEHRFLEAPGRLGFLYRQGSEVVAYGYAQASGRIGPVCARDPNWLPALLGHLVSAVRPLGGWQAIVPGPATQAFVPLLAAGLRIDGGPAIYCGTWNGPQLDRYLPMNFALN